MKKQLKFAVIGAGQRGQFAYGPYATDHPHQVEFVAVVEPHEGRRSSFCDTHAIPDHLAFSQEDAFYAAQVDCDAVLICTQDQQHFDMAIRAMEAGYHVLVEKPMSPDGAQCVQLGDCARRTGRIMVVCHVLRYTNFFVKLKALLDSGSIGKLITITHNENVGYYHHAHSYVRGNWRSTKESSPMILAKSCHDMDILLWLAGGSCTALSSFGSLSHFIPSQAPEGAAQRCIAGCRAEPDCPYSAVKIYLQSGQRGWPTSVITDDPTRENIVKALWEGPYGRCVYHCDNDVVDHQTVNLAFDNGVTAVFNMSAFTHEISRTIKLMGSRGELRGHMERGEIELHDFATGNVTQHHLAPAVTGHSGGDNGIMRHFVQLVAQGAANTQGKASFEASVHSHLMSLAAEQSRLQGKVVVLTEFEQQLRGH